MKIKNNTNGSVTVSMSLNGTEKSITYFNYTTAKAKELFAFEIAKHLITHGA